MNFSHHAGSVAAVGMLMLAACAPRTAADTAPRPPADFLALPDTAVCVVDRSSQLGLRTLDAKVGASGVVVFSDGAVRPLESVHPVGVIAGYAGREPWLTRGDPISIEGLRFSRVGGERRIGAELLERVGEHQGILIFAGRDDAPPRDAVYVPTAPGCIFQGFVREDLLRR